MQFFLAKFFRGDLPLLPSKGLERVTGPRGVNWLCGQGGAELTASRFLACGLNHNTTAVLFYLAEKANSCGRFYFRCHLEAVWIVDFKKMKT